MINLFGAAIVELPNEGVMLQPDPNSSVPDAPSDENLLALSIMLTLGKAGFEHHPRPRAPEVELLSLMLTGQTSIPWQDPSGPHTPPRHLTCRREDSSTWRCQLD
jgi:hypothetical protein